MTDLQDMSIRPVVLACKLWLWALLMPPMRWQAGHAVIIVDWYYASLRAACRNTLSGTQSSRLWLCQLAGNLLHMACSITSQTSLFASYYGTSTAILNFRLYYQAQATPSLVNANMRSLAQGSQVCWHLPGHGLIVQFLDTLNWLAEIDSMPGSRKYCGTVCSHTELC